MRPGATFTLHGQIIRQERELQGAKRHLGPYEQILWEELIRSLHTMHREIDELRAEIGTRGYTMDTKIAEILPRQYLVDALHAFRNEVWEAGRECTHTAFDDCIHARRIIEAERTLVKLLIPEEDVRSEVLQPEIFPDRSTVYPPMG